ncbi:hypothetical protein TNCV_750451 [Trichonephila clavipes]|nr:hypothetical protein TNCV_750451 [Trichonephila clavipes]
MQKQIDARGIIYMPYNHMTCVAMALASTPARIEPATLGLRNGHASYKPQSRPLIKEASLGIGITDGRRLKNSQHCDNVRQGSGSHSGVYGPLGVTGIIQRIREKIDLRVPEQRQGIRSSAVIAGNSSGTRALEVPLAGFPFLPEPLQPRKRENLYKVTMRPKYPRYNCAFYKARQNPFFTACNNLSCFGRLAHIAGLSQYKVVLP